MNKESFTFVDMISSQSLIKSLTPFCILGSCCREDFLLNFVEYSHQKNEMIIENEVFNPWQADLLVIAGPINFKQIELVQRAYEEMMFPKYVMVVGTCALTGGGLHPGIVSKSIADIVPVDVMVLGCPPKFEDLSNAFNRLRELICTREKN